jgi:hypothetical protein
VHEGEHRFDSELKCPPNSAFAPSTFPAAQLPVRRDFLHWHLKCAPLRAYAAAMTAHATVDLRCDNYINNNCLYWIY